MENCIHFSTPPCPPLHEFNGETFQTGDPVIYSVYPMVANGTGTVTETGIIATGNTAREMERQGVSLEGEWCGLFDVRRAPQGPRREMVYDPLHNISRPRYS